MYTILAQQPNAGNLWQTFIMIGVILLFFYFLLFRPEQKRRKYLESQRAALKKGDQISAFGIIGIIDSIKADTVILKTAESKIEIAKQSITEVRKNAEEKTAIKST